MRIHLQRFLGSLGVRFFQIVPLVGESLVRDPDVELVEPVNILIPNIRKILLPQDRLQIVRRRLKQKERGIDSARLLVRTCLVA